MSGKSILLTLALAATTPLPAIAQPDSTANVLGYELPGMRDAVVQRGLTYRTVLDGGTTRTLTIDVYRVSRRIPAGGSTTLEFRADRPGTFAFYSNLTTDSRHAQMRGELVVVAAR